MSESIITRIQQTGVIAICRKIYGQDLLRLAEALEQGVVSLM